MDGRNLNSSPNAPAVTLQNGMGPYTGWVHIQDEAWRIPASSPEILGFRRAPIQPARLWNFQLNIAL